MKKKVNKKALLGVGAGLIATMVGACCLFAKKNNDDEAEYVEHEIDDDENVENVDESVEEPEE